MMYVSAASFVAAFVHPWKASQQFQRLLYASGLGVVVFVILHLLSENLASTIDANGLVDDMLAGAGAAFFVLGTVLFPAGFLAGAVGAVVMSVRERHSRPGVTGTAA